MVLRLFFCPFSSLHLQVNIKKSDISSLIRSEALLSPSLPFPAFGALLVADGDRSNGSHFRRRRWGSCRDRLNSFDLSLLLWRCPLEMAMVPPPSVQPSRQPPPPPSPALLQPQPPPDSDRSSGELRAMDCNLVSLCDHIQMEGFHSGAFSDVVVQAMGSTYRLHRLILSRSSYFRCNSVPYRTDLWN